MSYGVHRRGGAATAQVGAWLYSTWVELEELQGDFPTHLPEKIDKIAFTRVTCCRPHECMLVRCYTHVPARMLTTPRIYRMPQEFFMRYFVSG